MVMQARIIFVLFSFLLCISASTAQANNEIQLKLGLQSHKGTWDSERSDFDNQDHTGSAGYYGFSLKNKVGKSQKHFIGVGVDFDTILDDQVRGYRAIDYQYALFNNIRIGGFIGAASIDTGFPQNGYYTGFNLSYHLLKQKLGIGYELRIGDGLARDRKSDLDTPADTSSPRPDIFLDFQVHSLFISWAI